MQNNNWQIMLIINITPDSFSDGGNNYSADYINNLQAKHPDILIDIGAESTNPNSQPITAEQEWSRLEYIINNIKNKKNISIDTYKASTAQKCLERNINIINDVSGLDDPEMPSLIANYTNSKIIINHHTGIPASYTPDTPQENIIEILLEYFHQKLTLASQNNIKNSQIILDPGLGFGKHTLDNYKILDNLSIIKKEFDLPILIGASRKRFIRERWGIENQDYGTNIINSYAIKQGANIIRTHNLSASGTNN